MFFTKNDFEKIAEYIKANSMRDTDFPKKESVSPSSDILTIVSNGINYKISISDLLQSGISLTAIDTLIAAYIKASSIETSDVIVTGLINVDANNIYLDNDKGTTLLDVLNYFDHTLNDTTLAAKNWRIELGTPSSPSVRESYYLKDYKGNNHGLINIYKDSAILDIKVGYENASYETPEGQKPYINPGTHAAPNDDRLCILYSLSDGTLDLVKINLSAFLTEAEVDLNKGLGVDANTRKIYLKLADDVTTRAYISFNENTGELSASGIEDRILLDLGTFKESQADDKTMWGQYKKEEGTKDSLINDNSRWGQYKLAEADRNEVLNTLSSKVDALFAGAKINIAVSPNTIYKDTNTQVNINASVLGVKANLIKLFEDSTSGTIINLTSLESEPSFLALIENKIFNLNSNSKTIVALANYKNALFTVSALLHARYPIYKGFGSVYNDVVNDNNKLSARTYATGRNYQATATADNQRYFILIPSDIPVPSNYTMGGAPYVFNISTQTINNISYTVLTSGATYDTGASVDIVLS